MRFIKNGPDIPERLLQAHEDGHVVFFCGAGISYPARLPDFDGLTKSLYNRLGVTPNPVQAAALKAQQYDTAIGLLEDDHPGGRVVVRKELAAILTPADTSPKITMTHEALLTLGRCRNGKLHLITTNFDRLFDSVITRKQLKINTFQAPLLPVPKKRWDGIVYLHGLLSPTLLDNELDCLVVSSGDFGLAYLTERWAARFVSELFRHYTICFVGFSLRDPVLRYMMDALAADRQRGESPLEIFAFGGYIKGKEVVCEEEWRSKNVTPILYWQSERHRYLHMTLQRWSETYRDGVRGKELIVINEAIAKPRISTTEDDFVSRVLWALSDTSGLPARRFAELDPVPSLDWLKPLSEERYRQGDLNRFGVTPNIEQDKTLTFSLLHRPAPYNRSSWMALIDSGSTESKWDDVMSFLADWLIRYLDDPNLLLWLAKNGGHLHDRFVWLIEHRLHELSKLERDEKIEILNAIRVAAPQAIPRPMLRIVWRLLLSGRVKSRFHDFDLIRWEESFICDGLTPSLRLALRELLSPCIELREPFRLGDDASERESSQRLKEIIDWDLRLRTDHVYSIMLSILKSPKWQDVLPILLPDFNLLLRDALDLMRELGGADERNDISYLHQPSISEHSQNRKFHDWTVLIEFTRDAWIVLSRRSPDQARLVAQRWQQEPYPLFKRLAFFAAAQDALIPSQLALNWLLDNECWWLWSIGTQREAIRLIITLPARLELADMDRLVAAILAGPPRAMFKDDIDAEDWVGIVDYNIWLRLAKMVKNGVVLRAPADTRWNELSSKYSQWQVKADERDEFPFWMGDGDEWRTFVATPHNRLELIKWLKQYPSADQWNEDDWSQRCRDDFATTSCALIALSREGIWPVDRWREALHAWAEEKLLKRSWRYMAPVIATAPNPIIVALANSLSWWLEALIKSMESHQDLFFSLCLRILSMDSQDVMDTDDLVSDATNHPVGHVTEALLRWLYRRELKDNEGLPDELKTFLTKLCDSQKPTYRYARVLLAANVITLFRVDPEWTIQNLLPHFDWDTSVIEARAVWEGFLWSPRGYRPLLERIKHDFLNTARHYNQLGEYGQQYAFLLTFVALEPHDIFKMSELKIATDALPADGLHKSAQSLVRALEGAGEQRAEYWHHRIQPYWKSIWPKSREHITQGLSETISLLCIVAQNLFHEACELLWPWLQPIDHPSFIVNRLDESGLVKIFPEDALAFLNTIIDTNTQGFPYKLSECLKDIKTANPILEMDGRFRRLMEYLRRYGRE